MTEPAIETVVGGFVTPRTVSGVPGELGGAVHRADGGKVALSERFGGHRGDVMRTVNPDRIERPADAVLLGGRGLYLGHYMGSHYGHFLTETLSSFWVLERMPAKDFDYFLFHPFLFGEKISGFAAYCFERFGIDPARVVFTGATPLGFDELVVPERLMRLNHSVDPHLEVVYARLVDGLRRPGPPDGAVYLSKRRLSARRFHRVVANEVRIEAIFKARGFEVVYPEEVPFEDQLRLYCNAATLAGLSGSALHNSVFMREGARLIELGDPRYHGERSPTQALCDSLSGVEASFIPFAGREIGRHRTMIFNTGTLEAELARLGLPGGPGGPGDGVPSALRWALDTPEVVYLSLRPSVGGLARDMLGQLGVRRRRRG